LTKEAGKYIVNVEYQSCKGSDTAEVFLFPLPVLKVQSSYDYCNEDSSGIKLETSTSDTKYQWYFENNTQEIYELSEPGKYLVVGTNRFGCKAHINTSLSISCPPRLFISSAFSPNGDDKNNLYLVHEAHVGKFQMLIFNRWGEIIFESNDKDYFWDGTYRGEYMPIGVYPWIITYEGNSVKYRGPYKQEGSVTIIK
jgi:gliding motility-associated-like protein